MLEEKVGEKYGTKSKTMLLFPSKKNGQDIFQKTCFLDFL